VTPRYNSRASLFEAAVTTHVVRTQFAEDISNFVEVRITGFQGSWLVCSLRRTTRNVGLP